MKKKLISLFCAAALAASSVAGIMLTASAAETTLWSDTFNGYDNVADANSGIVGKVLVDGTFTAQNQYAGIDGITLITANRGDDSSFFKLTEDANGGKALTTQVARFSNAGRGAQIVFGETYAPSDSTDLVLAFKVKTSNAEETSYDTALELNGDNAAELKLDSAADWTNVKVVITTSGTTAYIGDSTTAALTARGVRDLSSLKFNGLVDGVDDNSSNGAQKAGTSHPVGYPTISLDDVVIYTTDAGNGLASSVPAAQTHGNVEVDYEVVPKGDAPGKIEKMDLGLVASDNFNSKTPARLVFINTTEEDSTYDELDTVTIFTGTDSDTHSETKWEIIGNPKTDPALGQENYLKASNSVKSTANRGPKLQFKLLDGAIDIEEREGVVVQFAARLHKTDDAPAELIFSGDLTASSSKGNLASPLAMITTDAEAASAVYTVDHSLEKGSDNVLQVEDNKWVLVTIKAYRSEGKAAGAKIIVTDGEKETYIFGSEDSYADIQDSTGHGVNNLPYVSFRSGNDDDYGVSNTTNDIDNIDIYSTKAEATESTPTPAPATPTPVPSHSVTIAQNGQSVTITAGDDDTFSGVLIHAKYDGGVLKSATFQSVSDITKAGKTVTIPATDTIEAGDKLLVWNTIKGMVPYGTVTVQ